MRVAVASWTIRHAGGVESYVEKIIPAMRAAGSDVSFFHEIDGPTDRARIDIGDVPLFSAAASGVDAAVAALRAWKPDVMYMHGLHDPHTFDAPYGPRPVRVVYSHIFRHVHQRFQDTYAALCHSVCETIRPYVPCALFPAGMRRQESGDHVAVVPERSGSSSRRYRDRMPSSRTARTCSASSRRTA